MSSPGITSQDDRIIDVDSRQRLKDHFSVPLEKHQSKWADLWDRGDFLPWDKGMPSPALVDLLHNRPDHQDLTAQDLVFRGERRKRALVPGCGRGYDVYLLAMHGYDAFGVEISGTAVRLAREWACNELEKVKVEPGKPPYTDYWGRIQFVEGDFFKDDWVKSLHIESLGGFDLIYDYTFLCALQPTLRSDWATRISQLLAPGTGILICLEFPLYKSIDTGGPPWGLKSEDYDKLLKEKGQGFEKFLHFQPPRSHQVGKGTDWLSIWRKK